MRRIIGFLAAGMFIVSSLTGCGASTSEPDDYVTNDGYESEPADTVLTETDTSKSISREDIKVGVLYISDPADGSGYSYTHDLGILGMQSNLGLSDDQIERKIVDDADTEGTKAAIEECISDGCNIIFSTSWGYMGPLLKWRKNIQRYIFPMAQDTCRMARISIIISVEFTSQDI